MSAKADPKNPCLESMHKDCSLAKKDGYMSTPRGLNYNFNITWIEMSHSVQNSDA